MSSRNKRVITVAWLCHFVLLPTIVTSQLLPSASGKTNAPAAAQIQEASGPQEDERSQLRPWDLVEPQQGEQVTIKARQQEKHGSQYHLSGEVEIDYREMVVQADDLLYDADTGQLKATGHIVVDGGPHDEHIEASRGEYNLRSHTGKFYDVVGTSGVRFKGKNVTLLSENPFAFTGKEVEQTGPDHFIVHSGTVTSCRLPKPKWTFAAEAIDVTVGGNARIYNSTFRIRKLPVFYFPFAAHPAEKLGRQSGFLVPTAGVSSRKGTIIGDSFYWDINRSADATLGAEYYSSRGWAQHGEFRARPGQKTYLDGTYFGVIDRGFGAPKVDQGGEDIHLNAESELPHGVRAVATLNYLSRFVFRLAFTENFAQAVNSEVKSNAFVTKEFHGLFLNGFFSRYQNFQSIMHGDLITIVHAPSFELSSVERRVPYSPIVFSIEAAAEGVSRREPQFKTAALVGRYDLHPAAAMPLFFHGWSVRPEIALRDTYYSDRKVGGGIGMPKDSPLNRRAIETSLELRPPALARIFEKKVMGATLKHTIEPRFNYHIVRGVTGFNNTIRFDARDILSDTDELEYALVQHLYAKRPSHCDVAALAVDKANNTHKCSEQAQDVITWEVAQRYYFDQTFGGAVVPGKRNVLTSTDDLTGIAFLTEPRRFSPVVSRLRVRATERVEGTWQLDYDTKKGRINNSTIVANVHFGDFFIGGSHAYFHVPGEIFVTNPIPAPSQFDQMRAIIGYGGPSKLGWSGAASIGMDNNQSFLQYGSLQSSYNWDCCGVSMEYRRFALGTVRNENQFRFAFTLANIGSFGNLKRSLSLY